MKKIFLSEDQLKYDIDTFFNDCNEAGLKVEIDDLDGDGVYVFVEGTEHQLNEMLTANSIDGCISDYKV